MVDVGLIQVLETLLVYKTDASVIDYFLVEGSYLASIFDFSIGMCALLSD